MWLFYHTDKQKGLERLRNLHLRMHSSAGEEPCSDSILCDSKALHILIRKPVGTQKSCGCWRSCGHHVGYEHLGQEQRDGSFQYHECLQRAWPLCGVLKTASVTRGWDERKAFQEEGCSRRSGAWVPQFMLNVSTELSQMVAESGK